MQENKKKHWRKGFGEWENFHEEWEHYFRKQKETYQIDTGFGCSGFITKKRLWPNRKSDDRDTQNPWQI